MHAANRANNLRSANRIGSGQRLKIPLRGATVRASTPIATGTQPATLTHNVRRGESLWKLASRYGTTVDRIKRDNGLRSDRLSAYQQWPETLEDALTEETRLGLEVIRSGETREGATRFASGAGRHGDFEKI